MKVKYIVATDVYRSRYVRDSKGTVTRERN